jgi:hypothetical protein
MDNVHLNIKQTTKTTFSLVIISIFVTLGIAFLIDKNLFFILLSIVLVFLKLYLQSKQKPKGKRERNYSSLSPQKTKSIPYINKIIKISSIFNSTSKEIIKLLYNDDFISNYKINYKNNNDCDFQQAFDLSELKFTKKVIKLPHDNSIILERIIIGENTKIIYKIIIVEAPTVSLDEDEPLKKCRVTIFMPLRIIEDKILPIRALKTIMDSLDLLQFYIKNLTFKAENQNQKNINEIILNSLKMKSKKKLKSKPTLVCNESEQTNAETKKEIPINSKLNQKIIMDTNITNTSQMQQPSKQTMTVDIKIDPEILMENELCYSLIYDKIKELEEYKLKQWKEMDKKPDYQLYYVDEKSGLRSVRGESIIERNISDVWAYICDIEKKNTYDKSFNSGYTYRDIDEYTAIQYMKYNGKMGVSPRDFTIISHKIIKDDERAIIACSINNENKYPRVPKVERAELKVNI